jgi:hypothetical protein
LTGARFAVTTGGLDPVATVAEDIPLLESADMIGAVMVRHRLAQAVPTAPPRRSARRGRASSGVVRVLTLLFVAAIVFSPIAGNAVAESAFASLLGTSANVRPPRAEVVDQAPAPFVTGTVWEDTTKRNGTFDNNEVGLAGVTIIVERVDVPGGPFACTTGTGVGGLNINPTDSNGRYRCEVPAFGEYRVSITMPSEFEATTSRERRVSISTLQGATANFGLAHLDTRIRTVGGLVFLDCNENGIQDLQVEFDRRPSNGSYEVTLERLDGRNSQTPSSTRQSRYSFDNLESGSYVVSLRISDSRFKATTSTRREVTIGTTFGAVADFGLIDLGNNSDCARAARETATVVLGTATAVEATSAAVVATAVSRGGAPGGPVLPPQTATAVAQAAAATAARLPTSTAIPTATPIPTARLERTYPRSARFVMQAIARFPDGRRIDMLAEGALIGLETIIFQDAGQRVGSEQLSMRIKRNERVDDIVVTAQEAYRQRDSDDFWRTVPYAEVRNELGSLRPSTPSSRSAASAGARRAARPSSMAWSPATSSARSTPSASGRPASGRSTPAVAVARPHPPSRAVADWPPAAGSSRPAPRLRRPASPRRTPGGPAPSPSTRRSRSRPGSGSKTA